ncbi:MAG: translation initiation factor IF-2, partial [Nitrospirota bacterium]
LAAASRAIIIGFNVRPEPKAASLAEQQGVDVRLYTIIYEALSDIKAAMEGLLDPTLKERSLGRAEVRQVFTIPKAGVVAGSYVVEGTISRAAVGVRLIRDNVVVFEGRLGSLRRFKDDVREVQQGYECGISIENFNDIKAGDVIEAYTIDKIAGKL